MAPRVLHLSTYDANGGAARAAYALHRAMLDHGIESRMHVARKETADPTVTQGNGRRFLVSSELDRQLWRLQHSPVKTWRSPARFASLTAKQINRSSADIVHLHWITDGFLSIEEIGRIDKPIVWSMYDMWPFAGTEHYGTDTPDARWRTGYTKTNRPADEAGVDLDRWAYQRKRRHWRLGTRPFHMVPASTWLTTATQKSALLGNAPTTRIPHVVDCEIFAPMPAEEAREQLGLRTDAPLVLFLASAGIHDERKGWDLLDRALQDACLVNPDLEVLVVGPKEERYRPPSGVRIHWHGTATSDRELALLYSAANVTAVPSREDNMPLTAMEAQSCGRPVVAFAIGGLPDIVESDVTGFLATPNDTEELAQGILQTLKNSDNGDSENINSWENNARTRATSKWAASSVIRQFEAVYEQVMA